MRGREPVYPKKSVPCPTSARACGDAGGDSLGSGSYAPLNAGHPYWRRLRAAPMREEAGGRLRKRRRKGVWRRNRAVKYRQARKSGKGIVPAPRCGVLLPKGTGCVRRGSRAAKMSGQDGLGGQGGCDEGIPSVYDRKDADREFLAGSPQCLPAANKGRKRGVRRHLFVELQPGRNLCKVF